MKKSLIIIPALCLSSSLALAAGMDKPILMTSTLNLNQVTHKLFPISDKKAPMPFYKHCNKKPPQEYTKAKGQAVIWYNPKTHVVKYAITYAGLSGSPIMAHFHLGEMGKGGPIVQTICGRPPKGNKMLGYSGAPALNGHVCPMGRSGFFSGKYVLKGNPHDHLTVKQEEKALLAGKIYINIHTCLNQAGELRGQIVKYQAD